MTITSCFVSSDNNNFILTTILSINSTTDGSSIYLENASDSDFDYVIWDIIFTSSIILNIRIDDSHLYLGSEISLIFGYAIEDTYSESYESFLEFKPLFEITGVVQ